MNVENGAEAALFPEKECIKEIFVAVYCLRNKYQQTPIPIVENVLYSSKLITPHGLRHSILQFAKDPKAFVKKALAPLPCEVPHSL
jgi:hypothetical protein